MAEMVEHNGGLFVRLETPEEVRAAQTFNDDSRPEHEIDIHYTQNADLAGPFSSERELCAFFLRVHRPTRSEGA